MKELDPLVFVAVFQEMMGFWLWLLLALFVVTAFLLVRLLRLEGGIRSTRVVRSQLMGLLGGVVALVVMALISSSGFTDAGGPADWFLIALVYGFGFVASSVMVYALWGTLLSASSRR